METVNKLEIGYMFHHIEGLINLMKNGVNDSYHFGGNNQIMLYVALVCRVIESIKAMVLIISP